MNFLKTARLKGQGKHTSVWISKCQFPNCHNFFSSVGSHITHYCKSHPKDKFGHIIPHSEYLEEFKDGIISNLS